MRLRGLLEPNGALTFENKKEEMEYHIVTKSSYLQSTLNHEEIDQLNQFLEESETIPELVLEPKTVNYKECLLQSFRAIQDPF